jgi:hypothetical protein
MRTICLTSLLVCALAAPAAAQEPSFATLEHATDHSRFHASVGPTRFDDSDYFIMRVDVGAQYVSPQGFGVYGFVPVTHADGDDPGSLTELADVELGGLYVLPLAPTTDVILQGGVALPTAPDSNDALINLFGGLPRVTDLAGGVGNVTWLALGASPMHRRGDLFLRADVGVDVPIADDEYTDPDPVVHLNVAAGVDLGAVAIAGELVNLRGMDSRDGEWLSTAALSVSARSGGVRPFGAVVLPVDPELADDFDMSFALVAGISAPIAAR